MDFEYLDAFARPNANKSYEEKPKPKTSTAELKANIAKTEAAAIAAEQKLNEAINATAKYQDAFARPNAKNGYEEVKKKEVFITAAPTAPQNLVVLPPKITVKTAPIDTVLFNDDSVPIEVMTDLLFENIGGHELINIARNDIINGQKVSYQPIKNISSIQQQYNPNNILGLQNTSDKYFSNFSIKLENKIPNTGSGPNGSNVYLDSQTGDLVIETVNIEKDEQIEIEITIGATIYEAEFGEITS